MPEFDETEVRHRFFDESGRLREDEVAAFVRDHGPIPELFTVLLSVAGEIDPGLMGASRAVALLLVRFSDWVPDVRGLFALFRRSSSPRPFVAWSVARAGLGRVVGELAPSLRSGDVQEREDALQLVDDAARYADRKDPPQFGAGGRMEKRPAAPVSVEGALPSYEGVLPEGAARFDVGMTESVEAMSRETTSPTEADRPIRDRVVNVEFAPTDDCATALRRDEPLQTGQAYYFRFGVAGERSEHSIEDPNAPPLPPDLKAGMVLTVALFEVDGGLKLQEGADVGELRILLDGSVVVLRQPLSDVGTLPAATRSLWLLFPVQAPGREGPARIRCSIYHQQVLLQSRLITAEVMGRPASHEGALRSEVDYALVQRFRPLGLPSHRLSLLVNDDGNGTHLVHLLGGDGQPESKRTFKRTIRMENLYGVIDTARKALRMTAWGAETPWDGRRPKYDDGVDLGRLAQDLVRLAFRGRDFYNLLAGSVAEVDETSIYTVRDELADLMRKPGYVQIAALESAKDVFPMSMIYDYPLKQGAADYALCETFKRGLQEAMSSDQSERFSRIECFSGLCPQAEVKADPRVVCPGGFWGFRHFVGMPLSLPKDDIPPDLCFVRRPTITAGVCTDLKMLKPHEDNIRTLLAGNKWMPARTRDELLNNLRRGQPQVVYFYCHGGSAVGTPYLIVGPDNAPGITPSDLVEERLQWPSRPLVFINGCETTALQPEEVIEFVTFFIRDARACGVIGTEITVFERWAATFAEQFLKAFLGDDCIPVGEAFRRARLYLLVKRGNPLGLAYRPLVLASLRLRRTGLDESADAVRSDAG